MKKYIFILFGVLITCLIQAQTPQFEKVIVNKFYQGSANALGVVVDTMGNTYTIGTFTGYIDFDPGPTTAYFVNSISNGQSSFIQKLDSNSNFIWVRTVHFTYGNFRKIAIDKKGNLYIKGDFKDSVDIDPGYSVSKLYSKGNYDPFILKLSSNGNFIWGKSFGGINNDYINGVSIDKIGNVYSTGEFQGIADLDPGSGIFNLSSGYSTGKSAYVQKLDIDGNFIWAKGFIVQDTFGGRCRGIDIDMDSFGNPISTGVFGGPINFGGGNLNWNADGVYVIKLDSLGNFNWLRVTEGVYYWGTSFPTAIEVDNCNNIYVTGASSDNVDFDPGPDTATIAGGSFLVKYDNSGNFKWVVSCDGSPYPNSLVSDKYGNIYTTGNFIDSFDIDPGVDTNMVYSQYTNSFNSQGAFIQKLNSNGQFLLGGSVRGCIGTSNGWAIAVDKSENIYAVGHFTDTVDFDMSLNNYIETTTHYKYASFLLKLSQCKTITTDNQTNCDSLTWMDGVTYYKSTNSAYFTLPSAAGCDSVICLNLTVPDIDTTLTVSTTGIFSSNQGVASYQWLDCNNGLSPITGEILQNFTPTANGSYAVALDVSGCMDTSACVSIQNVGVEEIEGYIINLFPNPATTQITLDLGTQNQILEILNIFSIAGQKVLILNNVQSNEPIDIQSLKPGIYLLEGVLESGERFVGKFVKE